MQHSGGQHCLDSMPDGVSKVDEVAQACFALVYGYYVGFYGDGAVYYGEEESLGGGAGGEGAACRREGRGLDGGEYFGGAGFEEGKFGRGPYCCGLGWSVS